MHKHSQRSNQLELLDMGSSYYTQEEYHDCLVQLDRVGRFLGGDKANLWAFNQMTPAPQSILDVGCGGGLFTIRLAKQFPQTKVIGIDLSSDAIRFAKEQLQASPQPNVDFILSSSPDLNYIPNSFDVITATLVCHHLSDEELISFLKQSYRIAKRAIILNDLHRHQLASWGFRCVAPILFNNRLITHDGLLSIRRSFTKKDWIYFLHAANIPLSRCSITWHWAFRWIIKIDSSSYA